MLNSTRAKEISEAVNELNVFSERYQLIHATVAIEQMYKEKMQQKMQTSFAAIRARIKSETNKDSAEQLFLQAEELKKEGNKTIRIIINYIPYIKDYSARTTRTENDNFLIVLPQSLASIRDKDGNIDFEKLLQLRKLMAHELGHIVLHSNLLFDTAIISEKDKEEEADYFAEKLLELRTQHGVELSSYFGSFN